MNLITLWHAMKSGFCTIICNDQLSGWTKRKLQSSSQSETCTKEGSWSLVVCCCSDPLQLSESQRNHDIWEVCSEIDEMHQKLQMPAAITGQQKGPNSSPRQCLTCTISASKLGYDVFLHLPYSLDFSPTWLPVLKATFCRENASTTSRRQEMLSKSSLNPEAQSFTL